MPKEVRASLWSRSIIRHDQGKAPPQETKTRAIHVQDLHHNHVAQNGKNGSDLGFYLVRGDKIMLNELS